MMILPVEMNASSGKNPGGAVFQKKIILDFRDLFVMQVL